MNALEKKSLSLYRNVLRQLSALCKINQHERRRAKLIQLVPADEIKRDVSNYMRQQYHVHKRQLHSGKITQEKVENRLKTGSKLLVKGLRFALDDASHEQNKRKHIEQSPFLFLLKIFTRHWGNQEYQLQLVRTFQKLTKTVS